MSGKDTRVSNNINFKINNLKIYFIIDPSFFAVFLFVQNKKQQ